MKKTNTDETTTISDLKAIMADFVKRRDWEKYHKPKNLSMSIAIEAAELMELFQWQHEYHQLDPEALSKVKGEIADVFAYLLSLCYFFDIDLSSSFISKMQKNELRFPEEISKEFQP